MNGTIMYSTDGFTQRVKLLTDKNGEPIGLGDYRYGEDGKRWRIVGIGERYVWGNCAPEGGQKRLKPEWLSKEEPDTWERILEDAQEADCVFYCWERKLNVGGVESFYAAMMADLVRRCKKLAGVD